MEWGLIVTSLLRNVAGGWVMLNEISPRGLRNRDRNRRTRDDDRDRATRMTACVHESAVLERDPRSVASTRHVVSDVEKFGERQHPGKRGDFRHPDIAFTIAQQVTADHHG